MIRQTPPAQTPTARSERRRQRSADPAVALGLLLDAVRSRQGYAALAIADESGLLVAGSGHFGACEELAAHAPLALEHAGREVQALELDGMSILVAGLNARSPGLGAAVEGCRRILSRRCLTPAAC